MLGTGLGGFLDIGGEAQQLPFPLPFDLKGHGHERRVIDLDADFFFHRGNQEVIIAVAADDGREQLDHRLSPDGRTQVVPGAVPGDAHVNVAAEVGIPQVDRRQAFGLGDLPQQIIGFLRSAHGDS
nr:hypothetical protein GCM10020185_58420 [Pseudomonas brassicacearum subsp. brassicacearum]